MDDEQVSYPKYISIMSGLLQNESELLANVVTQLQSASSQGDIQGCFDIVHRSIPSLSPYIAWEVVCDLLEARILGHCSEDMDIPYFHRNSKCKNAHFTYLSLL